MRFFPTCIEGSKIVETQRVEDDRGSFERLFCAREFADHGLATRFVQSSISRSHQARTLRGMHFQSPPNPESKLVSCRAGAIFDVVADLCLHSPTYGKWFGVELTPTNGKMVYVPEGCAHGFMTLEDDTEVYYQMTAYYVPELARGFRWDDKDVGISWPFTPAFISDRDAKLPIFAMATHARMSAIREVEQRVSSNTD
jgi:dTDP-4-dehydrorhamnose 3,5-epimerase